MGPSTTRNQTPSQKEELRNSNTHYLHCSCFIMHGAYSRFCSRSWWSAPVGRPLLVCHHQWDWAPPLWLDANNSLRQHPTSTSDTLIQFTTWITKSLDVVHNVSTFGHQLIESSFFLWFETQTTWLRADKGTSPVPQRPWLENVNAHR